MSKGSAIVTGAAQGIGRAIALRLADDGYDVGLSDLESKRELMEGVSREIIEKGRRALVVPTDVSRESDVEELVRKVVEYFGGLDVMVANAGICPSMHSITDTTMEEWNRTLEINAGGVFLCYKHAAKQMILQGRGGRMIGAASIASKKGYCFMYAYTASKFAVRGITQAAARELGKYEITVNAYAPGAVDTNMVALLDPTLVGLTGEEYLAQFQDASSLPPRNITPDEIAGVVSYLCSKDAAYITGQTISINGGRHFD
ncbi:NAD-binding protein [Mycena floridula]|nr:NAD-binding protein [Mycena floridula]